MSNREDPINDITEIVAPGSTALAHNDAGPAGSCKTTSTAKRPAAASASEIVYARWNSLLDPFGSGNQNRSHAVGSAIASSNKVGDSIRIRTKCGAIRTVSITVAVWSRAPKLRSIAP